MNHEKTKKQAKQPRKISNMKEMEIGVKAGTVRIVDITFFTTPIASNVLRWDITNKSGFSDHKCIRNRQRKWPIICIIHNPRNAKWERYKVLSTEIEGARRAIETTCDIRSVSHELNEIISRREETRRSTHKNWKGNLRKSPRNPLYRFWKKGRGEFQLGETALNSMVRGDHWKSANSIVALNKVKKGNKLICTIKIAWWAMFIPFCGSIGFHFWSSA